MGAPEREVVPPHGARDARIDLGICLGLAVVIFAVYAQVYGHAFLTYDDPEYVAKNARVNHGLTAAGVVWAFTSTHQANWHPLTTLTHMLDCQLFGLHAGAHLLVNVALHVASTLLLFAVLLRMTGGRWQSAFVAAVFAVHPLHVESVAWVSERKDVLSGVLWLLTLWAYVRYVEVPQAGRYALAVLCYALAALTKPMVVTLPFVLLLLDYWPLRRTRLLPGDRASVPTVRLVVEKLPFFAIAAGLSVGTYLVQHRFGAVSTTEAVAMQDRVANALLAYVSYLAKLVWPVRLAVFYPMRVPVPAWELGGAIVLLGAVTALAVAMARRTPALIVGWLWFLGTLVPVIGIVKAGDQAMADRYMYLAMIGILVAVAWGLGNLVRDRRPMQVAAAAVVAVCVAGYAAAAWTQVRYWRSTEALFEHAVAVTEGNYVAHTSLAALLLDEGKPDAAIPHLTEALRARPTFAKAHLNMGVALAKGGNLDAAIEHYTRAIQLDPDYAAAYFNLAVARTKQGRFDDAVARYRTTVQLKPDYDRAYANLGWILAQQGKLDEAVEQLTAALRINPNLVDAHEARGMALQRLGRTPDAIAELRTVVRLNPGDPKARYNLAVLLAKQGQASEAAGYLEQVVRDADVRHQAQLADAAREQLRQLRGQ